MIRIPLKAVLDVGTRRMNPELAESARPLENLMGTSALLPKSRDSLPDRQDINNPENLGYV
jgi:hypothetical protein